MTLIDKDYQQQLATMHSNGKFNHGAKAYKVVEHFIKQYQPSSVLDFGCGHGALIKVIHDLHPTISLAGYDPGNEHYKNLPSSQFDAVVSTDAIEHIEPEHLDQTLRTIGQLMQRCGCFRIACYPAKKSLPDGRNAHLIVQEPTWWREKLQSVMGVKIVHEEISVLDKTNKWAWVKGHVYDVTVEKA
jgi:cyclopropane fatty-acyl-phospholipid synthase-like methyltransferase